MWREGLRYLAAGALNTLLSWLLYLGLLRLLDFRLAYVLAFMAGVLMSYGLLRHVVFARPGQACALLRVAASHLLQLGLGLAVVQLWVVELHAPAELAPLVAVAVCLPVIFWLQRRIFKPDAAVGRTQEVSACEKIGDASKVKTMPHGLVQRRFDFVADGLRLVCVALPVLMLAANLLAWWRWGMDLPFLDDWFAYAERTALSLAPAHLFKAINNTLSPVGVFLDVMAQRWLGGNTPAYQTLSMFAVLGGLLWAQWRLLGWALRGRRWLAPGLFLLTIFMLQPGSYWGEQNLAYQQALPPLALLLAAWCNFAAGPRMPGRRVWVAVLGLLAGLSYISGAVAALVMGAGWLLLAHPAPARAGALAARGRAGGAVLSAVGLLTTVVQVVLTRLPGADPRGRGMPLTWPTEADFWWYAAGKLGRASGLGFASLGAEAVWVTLLALALLGAAAVALRGLRGRADVYARRVAWLFLPLLAAVLVYLALVSLGRAGVRDPELRGGAAVFRFGYLRFHFFWLTLLLPWAAAAWASVLRRRECRLARHRAGRWPLAWYAAAVLGVLGVAASRGVFDVASFYRDAAGFRADQLRCMQQQQGSGQPMRCRGLDALGITDWEPIYRYAQKIGASFVRYLPIIVQDEPSAVLFDWDDPEQRRAVHEINQQPLENGWRQAQPDPQFVVPISPGSPAAGQCAVLGVQVRLTLEHPDTIQLFFRPLGQAGYSEAFSARRPVVPEPGGRAWASFVIDSDQGFEPELRLDPIAGPGRFRLQDMLVTCRLRAGH
ncbi:MAG: GtrA family protein [Burkholderiaceae bacterium]|jgi:putative flippase GtrA|nr:GtrA family protein [Burkholderiaceae bacterium]